MLDFTNCEQNRLSIEYTTVSTDRVSRQSTCNGRTVATFKVNIDKVKSLEISVWLMMADSFEKDGEKS
jgi:hypothetical protein